MNAVLGRVLPLAVLVVVGWGVSPSITAAAGKANVELASAERAGASSGTDSFLPPSLNGDGRYLIFRSRANGIVPEDLDGDWDLYRKDLATGKVESVSEGTSGPASHGDISANGRFVAFYADRTYVRDLRRNTTSVVDDATPYPLDAPAVSDDGNIVAAVTTTGAGSTAIRVVNRALGTVVDVGDGVMVDLTPNGRWVVFDEREGSTARLLRVDLSTGERVVIYEGPGGAGDGPVLPFANADASVVTFTLFTGGFDNADALLWEAGHLEPLSYSAVSAAGQVSDDGSRVVLFAAADSTDGTGDVVVLDRRTGGTTTVASSDSAWSMSLSRNGNAISWTTPVGLSPRDDNGEADVYVTRLRRV